MGPLSPMSSAGADDFSQFRWSSALSFAYFISRTRKATLPQRKTCPGRLRTEPDPLANTARSAKSGLAVNGLSFA
jgi:hypothetical protein